MNHRNVYQDYRAPAFYMITMTTLERRPIFATCADSKAILNDDGWLVNVCVSRRSTSVEISRLSDEIVKQAALGTVVISPFISQGEKEIAITILDSDRGDVILMKPDGFGDYFKPKGRYFDLCTQGRLLILSAYSEIGYSAELTREKCLAMNTWCEHIALEREWGDFETKSHSF